MYTIKDLEEKEKQQINQNEQGFTSDSSSNDFLEKCLIRPHSFCEDSPLTCEHAFCTNCISLVKKCSNMSSWSYEISLVYRTQIV